MLLDVLEDWKCVSLENRIDLSVFLHAGYVCGSISSVCVIVIVSMGL